MANLGPLYQNQTYSNLLQVDGGLTAELKPVLDGDGNASGLTLSLTGVGISGLVAASASNLNAGLAGTVPYQIAPNITGFTTVGTSGYVLASTGVGAPIWTNTVPNSTYSSLAVDVSGGAAGQVLYQSDANNTSFTGVGTLGQVLVSGGAAAPYWSSSVPAAGVAGSASNISGGVSGNLLYQADVGLTHYVNNGTSGQLLRSQGSAAPVWATITAADVGSLPLDGSTAMTGNLSMGSHTITNLLNPLASTDAANKAYVDSVATGLKIKSACRVASTTNLVLSGLIAVDGVTVNNADRVLVKNQSFQDQNGIYVASATSWTRATDADTWEELVGATCFITEGSTQANTTWASNITAGGTIGVTPITFVLFGASASYTAGTGLTLIGSQFALATPVSVANGGSGVTTLTGIIKGNGASAFTAATGADVVSLIGATAVQNATTAGSCSGNALTATTLQTARTINGVSFNGSANITVTANTTGSLNVVSNGLGDAAPFSFNGSVTRDLSYNSIGAAAVGGSNATGTWPISITGNAANISGIVGTVNGGTGYASYAIGDLLYASAPTVLSKLPIGSSDRILRSTGSVPSWGQVELNTTVVTGTLPTTRGGTGLAAPFGTLGALYANTSTTITTGILPVSYGGTGAATLTGYVKGNGTSAMTAVASIPNTDVSGLGTLSTQNANAVTITGGTINGTSIGASTPSTGSFSDLTTSGTVSLNGYITVDAGAAYLRNPRIRDDSQTNWYRITPSELTLDVYTTLPALTGNDTFVFQNHTQTLTNKTLTSPTISGGTITGTRSVSPNTTDFLRADGAWAAPAGGSFINVMDYGAVADNSTNNYTAFTNAINAAIAAKKPLFIPGGQFVIGSQIYVTTPVDIYSDMTAALRFTNTASCGFWFDFGGNPSPCDIRLPLLAGPGLNSSFQYPGYPSVSVSASSITAGNSYIITSVGTTNFVAIGAPSNTVGVSFVATGTGSGTGTAITSSWTGTSRYGTALRLTGGYCHKVFVNWVNTWNIGVLYETANVANVTAGNININIGNIDLCTYGVYLKSAVGTTGIAGMAIVANTIFAKYPIYCEATYNISDITMSCASMFANEAGGSVIYASGTELKNSTFYLNSVVAGYWGDSPIGTSAGTVVPYISGDGTQNGETGFFRCSYNKISIQPNNTQPSWSGCTLIPVAGRAIRIKDAGVNNQISTVFDYVTTAPIALSSSASEASYNGGVGGAQYSKFVYSTYTLASSMAVGAGVGAYLFHQLAPSGSAINRPVKITDAGGTIVQNGIVAIAFVDTSTSTHNRQINVFFTNKGSATVPAGTQFYFWVEID